VGRVLGEGCGGNSWRGGGQSCLVLPSTAKASLKLLLKRFWRGRGASFSCGVSAWAVRYGGVLEGWGCYCGVWAREQMRVCLG